MTVRPLCAAAALAMLGACAQQPAKAPAPVTAAPASPATLLAGQSGEPRTCLGIREIRESIVRSDQVIDFVTLANQTYRVRLPNRCPQLGFERAFTYATSLTQLCAQDIITVINQGGGVFRGASCGLAAFVPISADAARAPLPAELK